MMENFTPPPRPSNITLEGKTIRLEPLDSGKHAAQLFRANMLDKDGINWAYLPYGPFDTVEKYADWIDGFKSGNDPEFFAIIRKSDEKAVGVASYLRINPADGSIEVGHINYSPLLQKTTEATEAMFLMMQWAFENGYRRYEWKCNARNRKSRNAAQRLGFSYEGVFRQAGINKGKNRDTAWFATIDTEWADLKQCFTGYLSEANFDADGRPKTSLSSLTKPNLYKLDNLDLI